MKNKIYIMVASIVLILLQVTFCEYVKIYGIKPNLVVVFIITLGFYCGTGELFFGGILCGILQDILLSKSIGVYFVINLLLCTVIEHSGRYSIDFLKFFVFSLLYDGLVLLFCAFPGTFGEFLFVLNRLLFGGALYNTVCFIIVLAIVKRKRKIRGL